MKPRRFSKPLTTAKRAGFAMTPGMSKCLNEIAAGSGISVAEVLRRFTARGIVDHLPDALSAVPHRERAEIQTLAELGGTE